MSNSITSTKCLVCFRTTPGERTENCEEFAIVFDTFCRLLKVDLIIPMQWNFEQDNIPFCAFCSSVVKKLKGLYDQIESLQLQMTNILYRIKHEMQGSGSDTDTNTTNVVTANNRVNYFRRLVVGGNGADNAETSLTVDPTIKVETELFNSIEFPFEHINESSEFENVYVETGPILTVKRESDGATGCAVDIESFPQDNLERITDSIFLDTNTPVCSVQELYSRPEEIKKTDLEDHHLCQFCEKSFPEKYSLELHLKQHLDEKNINREKFIGIDLPLNEKESGVKNGRDNFSSVIKKGNPSSEPFSSHKASEESFNCNVCSKKFSTSLELSNHENTHTGDVKYKCDTCDKTFARLSYLTAHKKMHSDEKPYKCDVCSKSFAISTKLTQHKRVHTGEKPYKCDVCNKTFTTSTSLNIHTRIHTGEKPYKCEVCFKAFSYLNVFTNHKRIHTGERPFECDVCSKTFSSSHTLTVHKRIHTGERPYKCEVCFKTFAYASVLNIHKRIHTAESTSQ